MDRIIIDGSRITGREDFFCCFRSQLGEEHLMGSNLDALHDALTSLSAHTIIEIRCQDRLAETLGAYWKRVLWMLNDCLDENRNLNLQFHE